MKAKDAIQHEARLLKVQHSKSSEIISQLKDAERSQAAMVANLEKQLAEFKNFQQLASTQAKEYQRRIGENSNTIESLKNQVSHLSDALKSKDQVAIGEADARRKAETELEKVQVKLESVERKFQSVTRQESEDEHLEALRVSILAKTFRSVLDANSL